MRQDPEKDIDKSEAEELFIGQVIAKLIRRCLFASVFSWQDRQHWNDFSNTAMYPTNDTCPKM